MLKALFLHKVERKNHRQVYDKALTQWVSYQPLSISRSNEKCRISPTTAMLEERVKLLQNSIPET